MPFWPLSVALTPNMGVQFGPLTPILGSHVHRVTQGANNRVPLDPTRFEQFWWVLLYKNPKCPFFAPLSGTLSPNMGSNGDPRPPYRVHTPRWSPRVSAIVSYPIPPDSDSFGVFDCKKYKMNPKCTKKWLKMADFWPQNTVLNIKIDQKLVTIFLYEFFPP